MDSDFKNVNHKKRKWISFISNEKGFNLPLGHPILQENYENNTVEWKYVVLNAGKELKLDTPIYYSYFFLRFFFRLLTAFPYQLFCLSWPPPALRSSCLILPVSPSIFLAFCLFKIFSMLPSRPLQIAAGVWLDNTFIRNITSQLQSHCQGILQKRCPFMCTQLMDNGPLSRSCDFVGRFSSGSKSLYCC